MTNINDALKEANTALQVQHEALKTMREKYCGNEDGPLSEILERRIQNTINATLLLQTAMHGAELHNTLQKQLDVAIPTLQKVVQDTLELPAINTYVKKALAEL